MATHAFRLDCPYNRDCGSLFRNLPSASLVLAPDLSIAAATKDYLAATQTSERDLLGQHMFDAFPDNPDAPEANGVAKLGASFERVRNSKVRDRMAMQRYDVRDPHGDFQLRYWLPINAPILDGDGKLQWLVHQVEDITRYIKLKEAFGARDLAEEQLDLDTHLLEAEIDQATHLLRSELEASALASEAKTQLITTASHDLRQPVQAAVLFANSLKNLPLPEEALERIAHIETSLKTLDRMLDDLLDLSRLETGQMMPYVRPFCVEGLLAKLADEFAPLAEETGLRFTFDGCRHAVCSDPVLLEQVLRNLIANAIKYTERGGIALLCRRRGGQIRIAVFDTGEGIPADQTKKIFEDYYQVVPSRDRHRGLGIGLATVAKTCKVLGHRLTVHSRVGRGSIFSVWLPPADTSAMW